MIDVWRQKWEKLKGHGPYALEGLMPDGRSLSLGVMDVLTSCCGTCIDDILASIKRLSGYDIILGPEYSFFPETGPLSLSKMAEYSMTVRELAGQGLLLPGTFVSTSQSRMYNTCVAFSQNMAIWSYDKKKSGGDDGIAESYGLRFWPGDREGILLWKGMRIGVEICADAGELWDTGARDLDLGFLVACGCRYIYDTMRSIRVGGYAVLCDGLEGNPECYRRIA